MPTINLAELAYLQHQVNEEREKQARIVLARELYAGTISNELASELEAALPAATTERITGLWNIFATAIDEINDRLAVREFRDQPQDRPDSQAQPVEWANDYFQLADLDELQHIIYEDALVDGESFILLQPEYNREGEIWIRPYPHSRYTSAREGGDNQGIKLHYEEAERLGQTPIMASKRWIEVFYDDNKNQKTRQRMTLYIDQEIDGTTDPPTITAARIEKYVIENDIPVQWRDEGDDQWPIWWTENGEETSQSLPLPIIHFRNKGGRRQGDGVQGAQIMLDNLATILMNAAAANAAPTLTVIGAHPTDDHKPPNEDNSNVWRLGWKRILAIANKRPQEASIDYIRPGDLNQLLEAIRQTLVMTAMTTGTPSLLADKIGRHQISGEALRQMDIRPIAATRQRQQSFGNAWQQMFHVVSIIHNALATGPSINPDQDIHAHWYHADVLQNTITDEEPEIVEQIEQAKDQAEAVEQETSDVKDTPTVDLPGPR